MKQTRPHFLKTSILTTAILGLLTTSCTDGGTEPSAPFVGGPENAAPDGSYTEAIYSPNGVASLEEVVLGGERQWLLIRGHDVDNPVLIFLHGGPGSPCIGYARYALGGLEHDFTVVAWDQRGCGKSYREDVDPASITLEQMFSDTLELINQMRARFDVEKVYLAGISWGAILGSFTARDHPELLHAYIGVGQPVHMERAFAIALQATLDRAIELGNQEAIDDLTPLTASPDVPWEDRWILYDWLEAFGFSDMHDLARWDDIRTELLAMLSEYTAEDLANLDRDDELYAASPLTQDNSLILTLDLFTEIPRLEVPVFFLAGRYDYKTPTALVEEYASVLEAPAGKQLIVFENSAHVPIIEERDAFHAAVFAHILP
jgi:pimeloyl-ACP methyl ester carboxylesterase